MVGLLRDFSEPQARLFLSINRFLMKYEPPDLHGVNDEDVEEAARALAATDETAARGVIYEHTPSSMPAERLARALKPFLSKFGETSPNVSTPDRAALLRRLADQVRQLRQEFPGQRRAYLNFVERVLRDPAADRRAGDPASEDQRGIEGKAMPRLILP
jgi:hypothetical protein